MTGVQTCALPISSLYLQANQEALKRYRSLCQTIGCEFQEKDAYVYSRRDRQKLRR